MLTIRIGEKEHFNDETERFVLMGGTEIQLEHSLVSLSKWESEWEKPFLSSNDKTTEETIGYIRAMTLTPNVPPEIYEELTPKNLEDINQYMAAKMSATWFRETPGGKPNREIVTAEIIYYWMTSLQIPFECQTWHLNRLFTLIKVHNQKNAPNKKSTRSQADIIAERNRLNAERKAAHNTKG